jgi:hypothetical protein
MRSRGRGRLPPAKSIIIAAISEPTITWPSPPQFQNFILKAGVRASEMPNSIAVSLKSTQIRSGVPNAPSNIDLISIKGFSFERANITRDINSTDERIAIALISIATLKSRWLLLVM